MNNLIRVLRPYKGGSTRWKWVRPEGQKPPSQKNSHRRKYVGALRPRCIELLGGRCVVCGYDTDIRALQIDHVNSDGSSDRKGPEKKSGGSYYHYILKNIASGRYQVLCANCNAIKRIEAQECPRKG